MELLCDLGQQLRCLLAALGVHGGATLQQRWVECPGEEIMCVIATQNSQSFGHCLHLRLPCLLAILSGDEAQSQAQRQKRKKQQQLLMKKKKIERKKRKKTLV